MRGFSLLLLALCTVVRAPVAFSGNRGFRLIKWQDLAFWFALWILKV